MRALSRMQRPKAGVLHGVFTVHDRGFDCVGDEGFTNSQGNV